MIVIGAYRYDCGIFVIKYMELWNGVTMRCAIVEGKMDYYRLKVICQLIMHKENKM